MHINVLHSDALEVTWNFQDFVVFWYRNVLWYLDVFLRYRFLVFFYWESNMRTIYIYIILHKQMLICLDFTSKNNLLLFWWSHFWKSVSVEVVWGVEYSHILVTCMTFESLSKYLGVSFQNWLNAQCLF